MAFPFPLSQIATIIVRYQLTYTKPPKDALAYTDKMDKIYSWSAKAYDGFMFVFPLWKKWLRSILPFVKSGKLLKVSFGPAWLMQKYPKDIDIYGLDYNETMVERAKVKLEKNNINAQIIKGNVEHLPFPDNSFDTVVNTMAFTGYPDGKHAMIEMLRVLKPDGVLLLLDYDYPPNRNAFGYLFVRFIELCGDIIKDIPKLIDESGATYERNLIGGAGSIQLFIIKPKTT